MRDQGIPAIYVSLAPDLTIQTTTIPIDTLFNTKKPNAELRFDFEKQYKPYVKYAFGKVDGIDLVIKHEGDNSDDGWRRALEVKLTVTPDQTTFGKPESEWSPELVIRPASTKYCALGMYDACKDRSSEIVQIFQRLCANVSSWDNKYELETNRFQIVNALQEFQSKFRDAQKPFLLQPIWKTQGKSPLLALQAFDLIVWSDFALCRAFIDKSRDLDSDKAVKSTKKGPKINRYLRASARLARVMYELATQGRVNLEGIYTQMAFGTQTDKEFSLPGKSTSQYLSTPRRANPILQRTVIREIILDGGEALLSPERRFDATVYFTAKELFGDII